MTGNKLHLVAGLGGIVFVIATLAAFFIYQGPPDGASGPAEFRNYLLNADEIQWQAVLLGVGIIGFLVFFGILASLIGGHGQFGRGLSLVVVGAASVAAVCYVAGVITLLVMAHCTCDPDVDQGREVTLSFLLIRDLGDEVTTFASFPAAALTAAVGAGLLVARRMNPVAGISGLAMGVLFLVNGALQELSPDDFEALGDITLLLFLLWSAVFAVLLLSQRLPVSEAEALA